MQYSILDSYKKDILENKTMTTKCKRILETSIDLFAKNGYSNTSTSEIAKIALWHKRKFITFFYYAIYI